MDFAYSSIGTLVVNRFRWPCFPSKVSSRFSYFVFFQVHKFASETLAEQVAQSVQALHVLVDKCGQLNAEFARVKALHDQIKETKKLVQILYENVDKISRQKK